MIRRQLHKFITFFKRHTGNQWQQLFASTSILGTIAVLLVVTVGLSLALTVSGNDYARYTLPYFVAATFTSGVLYVVDKRKLVHFGGVLLIFFYVTLGIALLGCVGIGPASIVLFSAAVIMAGLVYGICCSLIPTAISTVALIAFKANELPIHHHTEYTLASNPNDYHTILAIVLLLYVLATLSAALHQYLARAQQLLMEVEAQFVRQKQLMRDTIENQSKRLQESESEKVEQLYRFAEIGEMSTALMHDLANNLSALTLEIDDIEARKNSPSIDRAKDKIKQINSLLQNTRQQIQGRHSREAFDLVSEVDHVIGLLRMTAQKNHVDFDWAKPVAPISYIGERLLFRQLLTNLIKNAIDSYSVLADKKDHNTVLVEMHHDSGRIALAITDYGVGIKATDHHKIFKPFYTTKRDGMGMGLYLTKRFIEDSFGGSIRLESSRTRTTFIMDLPPKNVSNEAS
ncbi:MAG TPA: HAMP domain-containing sensor histidine kinase [Candidatus Saccharimonadales bacterium]|nr:HAMP domain-containing sensor histidine kinase [Candidatus Saccharimonadales bacterium]